MLKVELFTNTHEYVATVEIPPFPPDTLPHVVLWGTRVFTLVQPPSTSRVQYVEQFACVSLTPSPGLPRAEIAVENRPSSTDICRYPDCPTHQSENLGDAMERVGGIGVGSTVQKECITPSCALYRAPTPVDRAAQTLTDGSPVPVDGSHRNLRSDGQQEGYVVLSDEERAKGFIRPVRKSYKHIKCNGVTTMSRKLAETYARDPGFYSGTFCVTCEGHFPVGADGEFVWYGTNEKVGT